MCIHVYIVLKNTPTNISLFNLQSDQIIPHYKNIQPETTLRYLQTTTIFYTVNIRMYKLERFVFTWSIFIAV